MKKYNFMKQWNMMAAAVIILLAACTENFEEYNSHPYNPTAEDLTPSAATGGLFEKMAYQMHHHQENDSQMADQMVGDQYGGYLTTPTLWNGTNFSTFNQSESWNEQPFTIPFPYFYSGWTKVREISGGTGYIYAWANIIRVAAMLRVTDTYGPIPYSKMGGGQFQVAYDSVEDVYKNMVADLDQSVDALSIFWATFSKEKLTIAQYDIVYNGDFGKWIKFANSLKLRLAIRMSNVAPDYAKTVAEKAVAAGVFTGNADNAMLPATDNPYRKASADWGDLRLSADMDSYLNGYDDPRRFFYATLQNVAVKGVRMGINTTANSKSDYAAYSMPNFTATSPLLVMNAAEVAFLKAEGALRGWNMGGDTPQALYEQGIKLSMEQYNIGTLITSLYINNASGKPANYTGPNNETTIAAASAITIKWDDAASFEQKLERIITQKWLANFTLGFEAWSEYRRTGYPKLFPTVNNMSGGAVDTQRGARRLKFPISEYNKNAANVQAAIQMIGGQDLPSVDLWWAKKN
jgi:hypothetical protein